MAKIQNIMLAIKNIIYYLIVYYIICNNIDKISNKIQLTMQNL